MAIDASERQDAYRELRRQGFDPSSFGFNERREDYVGTGPAPVVGEVLVVNSLTKMEKSYKTGHGSSWVTQFSDDLKAGVFGRPSSK